MAARAAPLHGERGRGSSRDPWDAGEPRLSRALVAMEMDEHQAQILGALMKNSKAPSPVFQALAASIRSVYEASIT